MDEQEPWEQGLTLAFEKKQSCFEFYDSEPEIGHRFGLAMSCLSRSGGPMDAEFVVRAFNWSSIGDATIVDVGPGLCPNTVYHSTFVDIANWAVVGRRRSWSCQSDHCNQISEPSFHRPGLRKDAQARRGSAAIGFEVSLRIHDS